MRPHPDKHDMVTGIIQKHMPITHSNFHGDLRVNRGWESQGLK